MALSKNMQYVAAGILAAYVVFFTRPAPPVVVGVLASPIAQLVALGGVIYVGAAQSLLVALLLAVALVLSIPAREYFEPKKDEKKKDDKKPIDTVKPSPPKEEEKPQHAADDRKKETFANARDETLDGHPF